MIPSPDAISKPQLYSGVLNNTPLGNFRIITSNLGLVALAWANAQPKLNAYLKKLNLPVEFSPQKIAPYAMELQAYLTGEITTFTHTIDWSHFTPFQKKVLQAVLHIPYGTTSTYLALANEIHHPHAYRAVGAANGMNPMPIFIPCHRVLGRDGKLHGYGGGAGLPTKTWLLQMEATHTA